jgi:hypothetical protein
MKKKVYVWFDVVGIDCFSLRSDMTAIMRDALRGPRPKGMVLAEDWPTFRASCTWSCGKHCDKRDGPKYCTTPDKCPRIAK